MMGAPQDLDALIAGARQAPPTPSAEAATQGWARLRGQLGAVVVAPQIDVPPGLVESAAAGKAVATAAGWGWLAKAIASAAITVAVGGVGIAAVGPGRADPSSSAAIPAPSTPFASPVVASPVAAVPLVSSPMVVPAELPAELPDVVPDVVPDGVALTARTVVDPSKAASTRRVASRGGVDVEAPLISAAVQALSTGDTDRALEILATHRRRFPAGVMSEDREAVRIFALCRVGRDAAKLRSEFLRRWPSSPHAPKVRDACSPHGG